VVDGPKFIPFETGDLARALLLVRLRDRCPPPPPPVPCEPCRCPDSFERGPIQYSRFLERENEEYRAAREYDRICEMSRDSGRSHGPLQRPRPLNNEPFGPIAPPQARSPAPQAPPVPIPKSRLVYRQPMAPTGRFIDIFV
jgi:hypothetical protein